MKLLSPAFRFGDTKSSQVFISEHIKRLTPEERMLRFFANVKDEFIDSYVSRSTDNQSFWIVIADMSNNNVIAALHIALDPKQEVAEIGFSVETKYAGQGLGTKLMEIALLTLKPMKVQSVILNCLSENKAVQAICNKVGIEVSSISYDEKEGKIDVVKSYTLSDINDYTTTARASITMPVVLAYNKFLKNTFPLVFGDSN